MSKKSMVVLSSGAPAAYLTHREVIEARKRIHESKKAVLKARESKKEAQKKQAEKKANKVSEGPSKQKCRRALSGITKPDKACSRITRTCSSLH